MTGALVLDTPVITQLLSANNLTVASPTLGNPVIEQTLTANNLTTASVTFVGATFNQICILTANTLTTASVTFTTATFNQICVFTATELDTGALTIESPRCSTTGPFWIGPVVLDNGIELFTLANKIIICSDIPTTYTEATSTFFIGSKSLGIGNVLTSGPSVDTNGMKATVAAVVNGSVGTNGVPICWSIVDDANSRILARGPMLATVNVTTADNWNLDAFIFHWVAH